MKVSWQVTGIRKDPSANAHRIRVEEDKPAKERGYYTYPELFIVSQQRKGEVSCFFLQKRRRRRGRSKSDEKIAFSREGACRQGDRQTEQMTQRKRSGWSKFSQ